MVLPLSFWCCCFPILLWGSVAVPFVWRASFPNLLWGGAAFSSSSCVVLLLNFSSVCVVGFAPSLLGGAALLLPFFGGGVFAASFGVVLLLFLPCGVGGACLLYPFK